MKILRESWVETMTEYSLVFDRTGFPGASFSFPCDEHGNVSLNQWDSMSPEGRFNLTECHAGNGVGPGRVEVYRHSYRHPRIGACVCGATVALDGFTCTCDKCGRDYNMSGDLLASRDVWGEETGETWQDCI